MEYHMAQARDIILFLKDPVFEALYRCNPIYFFVDKLWDQVPVDWRIGLSRCSINELSLLSTGFIKDEFPDSFKDFLKRTRDIALAREQLTRDLNNSKSKIFNTYNLNPKKEHELSAMGPLIKSICDKLDISWCIDIGAGKGYLSQMLVHQYGINVLALDQSDNNVQKSIKIGVREANLAEKKRKDKESGKIKKKKNSEDNNNTEASNVQAGKYVAATLKLTKNTTLDEILELARDPNREKDLEVATTDNGGDKQKLFGGNFLLTGLHCCGGLSPTILRMFAANNDTGENNSENNNNDNDNWKMKGVVLLSCCYHMVQEEVDVLRVKDKKDRKLRDSVNENSEKEKGKVIEQETEPNKENEEEKETENENKNENENEGEDKERKEREKEKEEEERIDFPLSNFVGCSGITLGRAARLLACYAADKWPTNPQQLRKSEMAHAFRAALQVLLLQHYKEFCDNNDTAVGHIGETHSKDFYSYAKFSITQKLKLPWNPTFTEEYPIATFWAQYERKLPTISMFWNLRAILGPVIESLILLDRQLYLEEKGISAALVPIFDPCISPRNVAIIAP